ncbi:ribonuclease 3 [Ricinus communis]|nr:ribonuclease 3 [Ricinus communis]
MQWPPATCSGLLAPACNRPIISYNFTLHGLWPENNSGSSPAACQSVPFDISKLTKAGIINDLNKYWPNLLLGQKNQIFWKHEWQKHGTCSQWDLVDYFKESIKLAETLNLLKILESSGIKPDDQLHRIVDIKKAFKAHQLEPLIKCNTKNKSDSYQLHEIRLCVNKVGMHFEKCQRRADMGCGGLQQIIFPSAQSATPSPPPPPPKVLRRTSSSPKF